MNNSFLISVIVPALNAEKTLPLCLAAITKQSLSRDHYEVIVVDNGSEDSTASVAHSFGVRCILETRRNRGIARNIGIRAAHAPLIAFIDADTLIDYRWLETMVSNMKPSIVGGVQGTLKFTTSLPDTYPVAFDIGTFFHLSFLFTGACVYRTSALHSVGLFTEDLRRHEDVDLGIKVIQRGWVLRSTRDVSALTPACKTVRPKAQVEIGVGMVQMLDRWSPLSGRSGWNGVREVLGTWLRQFHKDTTVPKFISLLRLIVRSIALFLFALTNSTSPVLLPAEEESLPEITNTPMGKNVAWNPGARIVLSPLGTRLIHITDRSLFILEGSGQIFFEALINEEFNFARALSYTKNHYSNADTLEEDILELLNKLAHAGYFLSEGSSGL